MSVPGTVPQFSDIPAARDQLGLGPLATVTSIQGGSVSNGVFTVSAVGSLPDGTSGAPALAFSNETTLGLYRLSAGVIGITGGITAKSATDLVLSGGSSGASLTMGQGASGRATLVIGSDSRDALRLPRFGGTEYAQVSAFAGFTVIANKAASPAVYLQGTTDGTTYSTLASFDGVSPSIVGNLGVTGNLTVSGTGLTTGSAYFGATGNAYERASINGPLPSSSNVSVGISMNGSVPSGSTTAGYSFQSQPATAASAFTITDFKHFHVVDISKGAGSTVTNQYGLYVDTLTSGTNNYAIFTAGTAPSVLGGNLTVSGALQLGNAYAAGVVAATGTVDIKDSTGTTYHVLVHT